jgi:hypothetical protein
MDIEINAFNSSFYNIISNESKIACMRNVINCITYYDARVHYNKMVRNVSILTDDMGKKYVDETDKNGAVHRVLFYDGDHATKSRPTITKAEFSKTYEFHQLQWIDNYTKNDSIMKTAFDKLRGMVDIKREPDKSDESDKPAKRSRRGGKTKKYKKSRKYKKTKRYKKPNAL